jgi:predicted TIM-barrel fold metal-dependent hydrolase
MNIRLDGVALVDHHCHGIVREVLDRPRFEALLTEAEGPGTLHPSIFDSQAGFGLRKVCAPLLDLPRRATPDEYLSRRAELGADELIHRMLGAAGISDHLIDAGYLPERLTTPAELAALTSASVHEVVRLETVAETVITGVEAEQFADTFRKELQARAATAVAFKSIAAYRVGLELDPRRPTDAEVTAAAADWLRETGAVPPRLVDATLTRFLIWSALDLGLPLQFHVGYGDRDADLHRCDPLLLTPLLRATSTLGVPVMLLHNYPFHRSAGYLAQVFDHVFVDVGLALHNVGTRADRLLAELLELAPFNSVLFSSDTFGLAELYPLSATLFRQALSAFLDDGIAREFWSLGEAERIAAMIATGNARRAYRLESL